MRDDRPRRIGDQDRGLFLVILRHGFDAIVGDDDIAHAHFGAGRMMCVGQDAADHDRAARQLAEAAAAHLAPRRAISDAAVIGLRIVADTQRHLPQLGELGAVEGHAHRRRDLNGGNCWAAASKGMDSSRSPAPAKRDVMGYLLPKVREKAAPGLRSTSSQRTDRIGRTRKEPTSTKTPDTTNNTV